jgi:hypothetical protein
LPSQIFTPASLSGREEVSPLMNQSSSAMMARRKTRLVVRRGRMSFPVEGLWSENLSGRGAKMEYVPVPVLHYISISISFFYIELFL